MPLLEFECRACGKRFEDLVLAGSVPACPGCGGADLRRLLSPFGVRAAGGDGGAWAARAAGGGDGPGGCGSCGNPAGPGACGAG